ncbi:MAG: CbiQ family ECF transporter T component [Gaiellaceae bacterium]
MSPTASMALLAAAVVVALAAHRPESVGALGLVLLVCCLRASWRRSRIYLLGIAVSSIGLFLLWPLTAHVGSHPLWNGPILPVLGSIDVTSEELRAGAVQTLRLATVGMAFAAYALLVDHDRLVRSARLLRRSTLTMALSARLVPTLGRDALGLVEALRGRGVQVSGLRGHARLLSPLVAGSLERALALAEAMEARGYGRARQRPSPRTLAPRDLAALAVAVVLSVLGVAWL